MSYTSKPLVIVTGGSGFIGAYCLLALLNSSTYRVRTTVRSPSKATSVKSQLKAGGASDESINSVEFATADLTKDEGWDAALADCTYVLHVASPFPPRPPKHENDLIEPAREGTLRVLRAATRAGVRRVVVTSSVAAIWYGGDLSRPFTEADWSSLSADTPAYAKSKTLAERAAWDYIEKEGHGMELAVVNPAAVYGPLLAKEHYSTSVMIIVRLMNGSDPGVPDVGFGVVDVRDVANLHLLAMTDPRARGQRFIAIAGDNEPMMMLDIAKTLKENLGSTKAGKVPTWVVPNLLARFLSYFDPTIKMIVPDLGKRRVASNQKAKEVLGWQPRSCAAGLVATADSLEKLGLLKT